VSRLFPADDLARILAASAAACERSGTIPAADTEQAAALDELARAYGGLTAERVIEVIEACDAGNRNGAWWAKRGPWSPCVKDLSLKGWRSQETRFSHVVKYAAKRQNECGLALSSEAQSRLDRVNELIRRQEMEGTS
jgi:hypothetical protein